MLFISVGIILELFYAPDIPAVKTAGVFPAVKVAGFTFSALEIIVFGFIGIGLIYLLQKASVKGTINLGPKIYSSLTLWIILLIVANLFTGFFIFRNPRFIGHLRGMLLPPLLFIVFLNINISPYFEKRIFKFIIFGLIGLIAIFMLEFFGLKFFDYFRAGDEYRGLLYFQFLSVLVFNLAAAKLLFSKFRFGWLCILLLSFFNIALRITGKPAIFTLLVSCCVLLYLKMRNSRFGSIKVFFITSIAIFLIAISFMSIPQRFKDYATFVFASRYLKAVPRASSAEYVEDFVFDSEIFEVAKRKDLSAGRFGIWKFYLKESLEGYGMSPYGFGHDTYVDWGTGAAFGKSAHNLLVYFAYQCGLITAIIMLLLIIVFIFSNMKALSKLETGLYGQFSREEIIAIFSFVVSVIAVNMLGVTIDCVELAWFFWFCVVVLVKRWGILRVRMKTGEKPC